MVNLSRSGDPRHPWAFRARFRQHAFGWKSQPAIQRIREAVAEIKKVARKDPVLAAVGAVLFLEKVSPAIEQVDSSSGAIGTAVKGAVSALAKVISAAPADTAIREQWLERLFEAHAADEIPYIESLAEHWGELCRSPEVASQWADRLIGITRMALSPDKSRYFHGTLACLSSLFSAKRYDELIELLQTERFWPYRRWAVLALTELGRDQEAIRLAEESRDHGSSDHDIDRLCEGMLLSRGQTDDAYRRYGLWANRAGTYTAWFRAVAAKYTHKQPAEILADLVAATPGEEGKWNASAKDAGLFDLAIELANRSPCSPQTLTRAARAYEAKRPDFAIEAGMTALRWLVEGYGYEITGLDVLDAYTRTMNAAKVSGCAGQTHARIRALVAREAAGRQFVSKVLRRELGDVWGARA